MWAGNDSSTLYCTGSCLWFFIYLKAISIWLVISLITSTPTIHHTVYYMGSSEGTLCEWATICLWLHRLICVLIMARSRLCLIIIIKDNFDTVGGLTCNECADNVLHCILYGLSWGRIMWAGDDLPTTASLSLLRARFHLWLLLLFLDNFDIVGSPTHNKCANNALHCVLHRLSWGRIMWAGDDLSMAASLIFCASTAIELRHRDYFFSLETYFSNHINSRYTDVMLQCAMWVRRGSIALFPASRPQSNTV